MFFDLMMKPNLNGFVPTPSGWVKFQASPNAHYGGTCWCDGWHIQTTRLPGGDVSLEAVDMRRHSHGWYKAAAVIGRDGSRQISGDVEFPWHCVRPVRVWPARAQRARRVAIARAAVCLRVDGPAGAFSVRFVGQDGRRFGYAAFLAATGERILEGVSRGALVRAIRDGCVGPGARNAHWNNSSPAARRADEMYR